MCARLVRLSLAAVAALLVASCSSMSAFVADTLPAWAGGLPPGTPPRPGSPGYDAYLKSIGDSDGMTTNSAPATPPSPASQPSRKPQEPVDEPIH
jgi:hypothetical protein